MQGRRESASESFYDAVRCYLQLWLEQALSRGALPMCGPRTRQSKPRNTQEPKHQSTQRRTTASVVWAVTTKLKKKLKASCCTRTSAIKHAVACTKNVLGTVRLEGASIDRKPLSQNSSNMACVDRLATACRRWAGHITRCHASILYMCAMVRCNRH